MITIIADNLKKFRQQKNLTQEQAAEYLGVNANTVSRWERGTTLPDVTMLPELARLYCVTVDDFFKESAFAYENYARRLASVFDTTRDPEDFIRAHLEFKRLLRTGEYTAEDLRVYGCTYQFMAKHCSEQALSLFDRIIVEGNPEDTAYRRTRHQKMLLLVQMGRGQESIDIAMDCVAANPEEPENWVLLIAAFQYAARWNDAYDWFKKAITKFPQKAELYISGGDICKKLGRFEDALRYWDQALQTENTFYDVMHSKAAYYEEIGDFESAWRHWSAIVKRLRRDGYDIEAEAQEKHAQSCYERINR